MWEFLANENRFVLLRDILILIDLVIFLWKIYFCSFKKTWNQNRYHSVIKPIVPAIVHVIIDLAYSFFYYYIIIILFCLLIHFFNDFCDHHHQIMLIFSCCFDCTAAKILFMATLYVVQYSEGPTFHPLDVTRVRL